MKRFDCAIFDFDGTLVDSQWCWSTMYPRFFREKGYPVTDEDVEQCLTATYQDASAYFQKRFGVTKEQCPTIHEIWERMRKFYRTEVHWKPTVPEFLEQLRARGTRLCICSATPQELLFEGLERLNGFQWFERIFSTKTIGTEKDNPETFVYCLKEMGVTPEQTVLFDDAPYSLSTAKSIGISTYALHERCCADPERIPQVSDRYALRMMDFLSDPEEN